MKIDRNISSYPNAFVFFERDFGASLFNLKIGAYSIPTDLRNHSSSMMLE